MSKLIAIYNIFNEAELIRNSIQSIKDYVDEIWVFDGAYAEFPHDKPYSTDGTLRIIKKYKKVRIFEAKRAFESQLEKRNKMFRGSPGDRYLIIDGDEWCANPQALESLPDADVVWGWTLSPLYDRPYLTPRIIKHRPGLHYAGRHSWLFDGENKLVCSHQNMTRRLVHADFDLRIFNFRNHRKKERAQNKLVFAHRRRAREFSYRDELSVYSNEKQLIPKENRAPVQLRRQTAILKMPNDPVYTMIVPFSRPWAVEKWFTTFKKLDLNLQETEVLAVVDTDNHAFYRAVCNLLSRYRTRLNGLRIYMTGNPKLDEMSRAAKRRQRIISNWHIFLTEALGKIILGAEDDTLPEPDAYQRLLKIMRDQKADFVQGTEVGRWYSPVIPHWKIYDRDGVPFKVETGKYDGKDVVEIDGGGWYCFAVKAEVFRRPKMHFDNTLPSGPDVFYVYDLKKLGYKCLGVWSIKCEHFGLDFRLHPDDADLTFRTWIKNGRTWKTTEEPMVKTSSVPPTPL